VLAMRASGFMRLDVAADTGRPRLSVFTVDRAGAAREVYTFWLDREAHLPDSEPPGCTAPPAFGPSGERALMGVGPGIPAATP
jgi:hypothetical protein